MCGSRRVNVLRAPQCSERLVEIMFASLGSLGLPGTALSSNFKVHLARHQPLSQSPCQPSTTTTAKKKRKKGLLLTPRCLWAKSSSLLQKPDSPRPRSKINEHCHRWSGGKKGAAPLKEVLASQTDPWASVPLPKKITKQLHCTYTFK